MKPIPSSETTPAQREVAKRIGIAIEDRPQRSTEEWRAAADESIRAAAAKAVYANAADSYEEAEKLLREARHQLHIADGQLKRAFGSGR